MSKDSLGTYLDEIGRYPLLTAFQEIELSRQIRRMVELRDRENKRYTKAERRALTIGQKAKEKLMRHNLRLVVHIVRKFCGTMKYEGMEMSDFVQEGSLGLARACEMFDGTKGYKFSTYAYWWIKQSLRRAVDNKARIVRLPVYATEKMFAIRRFTERYRSETGKTPTLSQIAAHIEMSEDWVKLLMQRCAGTTSLDAKVGHSGEIDMLTSVPDPSTADLDARYDEIEMEELRKHLQTGLSLLPERERQIFVMRYGIDSNYEIMSLDKIGKHFGFCRERSRQLLMRATNNLRVKTRQLANELPPQPAEHSHAA